MASIMRFYRDPKHIALVLPIIKGSSTIPLRLFNWFVTNYCKDNHMIIKKKVHNGESYLNVYISYREQLKTYSKAQFDPFRRDEKRRIIFNYDQDHPEKSIETTVGQLNFFKWAIESGILDYIKNNQNKLEKEMRAAAGAAGPGGAESGPGTDPAPASDSGSPAADATAGDEPGQGPVMKTRDYTTVVTFD